MQAKDDDFCLHGGCAHLFLSSSLALVLPLATQQLPVDLGDLFQVIFQLVVVLNPATDFIQLRRRDDSAGRASAPQGDGQVPNRSVPLAPGALASWISAGHVALYQ